jgi:hypothetical protein
VLAPHATGRARYQHYLAFYRHEVLLRCWYAEPSQYAPCIKPAAAKRIVSDREHLLSKGSLEVATLALDEED